MSYFNYFPTTMYDPAGDGSAKLVTNIMKRVRLRANMKKELVMLHGLQRVCTVKKIYRIKIY